MNVKVHYSGLAISYNSKGGNDKSLSPSPLLPISLSRVNRHKRQIHDMVEWMRINATYKPLLGVLTVPVQSDNSLSNKNVSKFFDNLRKNYDLKNYVWVREYQGGGRPHFHFVADSKYLDAIKVSKYWSGLFDCDNKNSIRLGTDPRNPPRKFFVDSQRMSRYLTKYLDGGTKPMYYPACDTHTRKEIRVKSKEKIIKIVSEESKNRKIKTFGSSEECRIKSLPITYDVEYTKELELVQTESFLHSDGAQIRSSWIRKLVETDGVERLKEFNRIFTLNEQSQEHLIKTFGTIPEHLKTFNDQKYSWINPNPIHKVYYGIPKR